MENAFNKLQSISTSSAFSKNYYQVLLDFVEIKDTLTHFAQPLSKSYINGLSDKEFLELIIPKFQRDNQKWTKDMQIKFVENVVKGIETTIILGTFHKTNKKDCKLVDGQQRMIAIIAYLNNEFPIFDDVYATSDGALKYLSAFSTNMNLNVRIYSFNNESEMVKFYIEMNENFTHSKEDIKKAKDYLITLKG